MIETNFTSLRLFASRDGEQVLVASLPDAPKSRTLLAALVMEMDDNGFWPEGCDAVLLSGTDLEGNLETQDQFQVQYLDETGTTWVGYDVKKAIREAPSREL